MSRLTPLLVFLIKSNSYLFAANQVNIHVIFNDLFSLITTKIILHNGVNVKVVIRLTFLQEDYGVNECATPVFLIY